MATRTTIPDNAVAENVREEIARLKAAPPVVQKRYADKKTTSRAACSRLRSCSPVAGRNRWWAPRRILVRVLALTLGFASWAGANEPIVDMAEVRRLAREPVETILSSTPFGQVTDEDFATMVHGSPRPVVVLFYANQGEKSRNLATLARYLALECGEVISFYGYQVSPGAKVEREALAALRKKYGVKQIPATLFYDNDRGKIELEKADYSVPTLTEYRTPSMFLWKTYRQAVREYIVKEILD